MKNHKHGLFARMGGAFNRCFFILEMYGDDLEPDYISSVLAQKPTKAYRKGDERPKGSQYYRTGAWIINSGEVLLTDEQSGSHQLELWLSTLQSEIARWEQLYERYSPQICLVIYTDQMNAEFKLTPIAMQELSSRGLPLVIDPYLELDDDEV